jgi:hypothetical protein
VLLNENLPLGLSFKLLAASTIAHNPPLALDARIRCELLAKVERRQREPQRAFSMVGS